MNDSELVPRFKKAISVLFLWIFSVPLLWAGSDQPVGANPEIPPNIWVQAHPNYKIPKKYKSGEWRLTDGFCDALYRSRTGTILGRTGIASKEEGITPGFFSNALLEWNPRERTSEVIDVFEGWGGGSYGNARLLPPFYENPSPSPRHTYDGMAYDSSEDAVYLMLGATIVPKRHGDGATTEQARIQLEIDNNSLWKFTFIDRKWHRLDGNVRQFWNKYKVPPFESHLEYWPQEKKLIFLSGKRHLYAEFDIASQKWDKFELKSSPGMDVFGARSTWDSNRQRWIFRRGDKVAYLDPRTKSGGRLPDLPEKYGSLEDGRKPWWLYKSIAYIPKHDVYIVTAELGNDTFVYTPQSKNWRQIYGGDIELPNGYMEYDIKTDTVVLVKHLSAYKFRYVPES